MSEQQNTSTGNLPVPAGLDPRTPYAQWSVVECALCGARSDIAEHAEQGSWDVDHAHEAHPGVSPVPVVVWTISRARGKTFPGKARTTQQTTTSQEEGR